MEMVTIRNFLTKKALWVLFSALYLVGLFGDSYYGIIERIPMAVHLYDRLFFICSYTRNGIFFAPIFLIVGAWIGQNKENLIPRKKAAKRFVIFFVLMTVEGFVLRKFQLQRHDSMYLMLVPCMYYLVEFLLSIKCFTVPHFV